MLLAKASRRRASHAWSPAGRSKSRLAVEMIEVGADDCGFFQADAVVTDEIGDATRWIDAVVRTVRQTCLRDDDFDATLQSLLENHDSCNARVGRARRDVELHKRLSDCKTPYIHGRDSQKSMAASR